ncbi:UDP-glucose 4-epimerase GalE [Carnobacterium maltaromaticum]|uniref:UDP-glucose 4-epimerase GalE n=1 Tax=Carnobacterium maltaromaticum TaxID=2751 RepID=UPI000704AACF|nr:UDP-glucose 4-epimerase GalE [Carnobacterium maltaromaticum]MDT1945940.1 UDP-glucose 4-epimerase GalE [Carnobacterium maltaromaticum]MDT2000444.1 UDP-glucose 4-epimerase GalE [Carnobacterium maltaromaticum]TFJ30335.1 UDP-glucose 4-epimerase GalE [Carnobacterium maltaromaticum]TFJ33795.1 UDP-glucose 4-epimerase GalE [Carnobacterium maltaromaticum]TFJ37613.1 UDP-glucose 4-epimerase GalE [Carnobacterium maltaromaticum]
MTILVLGGAGYIGSHAVDQLISEGFSVAVVDNLQTGHVESLHKKARFYQGDIRDKEFLESVFFKEEIQGVLHFAANSLVGESMEIPLMYFNNNVHGTQVVLEVMEKFGVKHIVFSSSAATYGEPKMIPIRENAATNPESPYGESKLMMEKMLKWCDKAYGMRYVALRYFNVAGAKLDGTIGEDHNPESHLLPLILQTALGQREQLTIFGEDYDTKDGTCVRDYVHVVDLINAHILALRYLIAGKESTILNLGSSNGFSVKEMVAAARKITRREIPTSFAPRRIGDPSTLIAASDKAYQILGWNPQYTDIGTIIESAWNWHCRHPFGYETKNE